MLLRTRQTCASGRGSLQGHVRCCYRQPVGQFQVPAESAERLDARELEPNCLQACEAAAAAPRAFPLMMLGPLSAIAFKDRGMFDDKLLLKKEYRHNGVKDGAA